MNTRGSCTGYFRNGVILSPNSVHLKKSRATLDSKKFICLKQDSLCLIDCSLSNVADLTWLSTLDPWGPQFTRLATHLRCSQILLEEAQTVGIKQKRQNETIWWAQPLWSCLYIINICIIYRKKGLSVALSCFSYLFLVDLEHSLQDLGLCFFSSLLNFILFCICEDFFRGYGVCIQLFLCTASIYHPWIVNNKVNRGLATHLEK